MTTSDCFVATAASGNSDSDTVFYWRALRDMFLTKIGFTQYYYKHSKVWAQTLNEHPNFKPAVNFVLENTGKFLYYTSIYSQRAGSYIKAKAKSFMNWFLELFDNNAYAIDEVNPRYRLTFEQREELLSRHQPDYDFYVLGGILIPTEDKTLYDKYYPNTNAVIEVGSNYYFWLGSLGLFIGGKFAYIMNGSDDSLNASGGDFPYSRDLRVASIGPEAGLRFRSIDYPLFQPSIWGSVRYARLREEAKSKDDASSSSDSKNQAQGVTVYSPIYEFGAYLDTSITEMFGISRAEHVWFHEVLFRLSASYNKNPSDGISTTGYTFLAGVNVLLR